MSNSKPFYWLRKNTFNMPECKQFNTYKELKKTLPDAIRESQDQEICVTRFKRGEWGEWFEYWRLDDAGKLVKGKEGWM